LRRTKEECLDLPAKTYVVREVALSEETWRIYNELRKEAMLCLPDTEERPEPNAAVRILRLCQLTSGHVGGVWIPDGENPLNATDGSPIAGTSGDSDVSSEKLDYLVEQLLSGELATQRAVIVWCRWRRERERLKKLLEEGRYKKYKDDKGPLLFPFYEIYGGQSQKERDEAIQNFSCSAQYMRTVLLAQPHAGGYGLNLTAASTAVYLSNDFSYTTRIQSEDRIHRIGQASKCLYVDVLATGPNSQKIVDHHVLDCLRAKKSLAEMTCAQWKKVLA
jgi:SNF2 family DNA or RNA helicase